MPTWTRIHPGFSVERALQGFKDTGAHRERWRVTGLGIDGSGITTIKVQDLIDGAGATGVAPPPMYPTAGSAHPDIPNCVVVNKRVVKGPNQGKATIEVVYGPTPYLNFRGGPRIWGRPSAEVVNMAVPIYTQTGSPPWWPRRDPDLMIPRTKPWRARPKLVSLSSVTVLADAIEPNMGRYFDLSYPGAIPPFPPFIPWILGNYTFTETPNAGEALLTYHFWTLAPMAAMPASTFAGQNIALPALDYLQVYAIDDTVHPPVISAGRPIYLPGGPLP